MKNKTIIIAVSFIAVLICVILAGLLVYPVAHDSLVILSFVIGVVTGISVLALVINLTDMIRTKRSKNEK